MSPVPEPTQGGRVGPNGREDEELTPPMGMTIGPPVSSSDEEPDPANVDDLYHAGYQPLPQENDMDEDQDDAEIDYTSLSGLMSAISTNGPNVVPNEQGSHEADLGNEELGGGTEDVCLSPHAVALAEESARQRQTEILCERAAVWNSSSAPDRLILDGDKVEEIKSAMASFTLPQSAIPPWAQNLSEDDWKDQIAGLISRRSTQ